MIISCSGNLFIKNWIERSQIQIIFGFAHFNDCEEQSIKSYKGHMVDTLVQEADEGRGRLR